MALMDLFVAMMRWRSSDAILAVLGRRVEEGRSGSR